MSLQQILYRLSHFCSWQIAGIFFGGIASITAVTLLMAAVGRSFIIKSAIESGKWSADDLKALGKRIADSTGFCG